VVNSADFKTYSALVVNSAFLNNIRSAKGGVKFCKFKIYSAILVQNAFKVCRINHVNAEFFKTLF